MKDLGHGVLQIEPGETVELGTYTGHSGDMSKDEPIEQYTFPAPERFRQHTALRTMNRLTLAHTPAPVPEQDRRVAKARAEHYAGSEPEHATPGAMG